MDSNTNQKYISGSFGEYIPLDTLYSGHYFKNNCGGLSDWFTTTYKPKGSIFAIPYNNEEKMFIFHFYDENDHNSLLWKTMVDFELQTKQKAIRTHNNHYIILCSNYCLKNYDEGEESLKNGQNFLEPDEIGGDIYFSRLV